MIAKDKNEAKKKKSWESVVKKYAKVSFLRENPVQYRRMDVVTSKSPVVLTSAGRFYHSRLVRCQNLFYTRLGPKQIQNHFVIKQKTKQKNRLKWQEYKDNGHILTRRLILHRFLDIFGIVYFSNKFCQG